MPDPLPPAVRRLYVSASRAADWPPAKSRAEIAAAAELYETEVPLPDGTAKAVGDLIPADLLALRKRLGLPNRRLPQRYHPGAGR